MEGGTTPTPTVEAAEQALAYLAEMSPDVRGGAILTGAGELLAASGAGEDWAAPAMALLEAADRADAEAVEQIHVATEQGEAFLLRLGGLVAVVVTERFTLASVMSFDMRAVLRDLTAGEGNGAGPGGR
jgi:predicted regulator of Ras-like GTPase activity (Roadblock/LC7/MglB family)